jgi:hypothetical protein
MPRLLVFAKAETKMIEVIGASKYEGGLGGSSEWSWDVRGRQK